MGAWIKRFQFIIFCYTAMLHLFENLQIQVSAAGIAQHELRLSCRFGKFDAHNSTCTCGIRNCKGFGLDRVCMKRDDGSHKTFTHSCYMLAFACKAEKKKLFYWRGDCENTTGEPEEASQAFCNGTGLLDYCQHNGICMLNSEGESYCKCQSNYTGTRCETRALLPHKRSSTHRRSAHHRPWTRDRLSSRYKRSSHHTIRRLPKVERTNSTCQEGPVKDREVWLRRICLRYQRHYSNGFNLQFRRKRTISSRRLFSHLMTCVRDQRRFLFRSWRYRTKAK